MNALYAVRAALGFSSIVNDINSAVGVGFTIHVAAGCREVKREVMLASVYAGRISCSKMVASLATSEVIGRVKLL